MYYDKFLFLLFNKYTLTAPPHHIIAHKPQDRRQILLHKINEKDHVRK